MPQPNPARIAKNLRSLLRNGGSAERAKGVQWFFKEEIKSHGWRTPDLRRQARGTRLEILQQHDLEFLLRVADEMFSGEVLEEQIFAVLLLENLTDKFGAAEFRMLESWLPRISSWADHDALVYYLIGNMVVAKPSRIKAAFRWAKSRNRWHRRAAAVALIRERVRNCSFQK